MAEMVCVVVEEEVMNCVIMSGQSLTPSREPPAFLTGALRLWDLDLSISGATPYVGHENPR